MAKETAKGRQTTTRSAPELLARFSLGEVQNAYDRLGRQRALATLVRGALPHKLLRRMLRDAVPRREAHEIPDEAWASLAVGIALESPDFGLALAEALHDHLGWDREPATLDDWWPLVVERPLEALWNAALSADKVVRKEFAHIAQHTLENFRNSPECTPPSWEFIDAVLDVHGRQHRDLRDAERQIEEQSRRLDGERERLDELREELKRLRRENADLRGERAKAERRVEELEQGSAPAAGDDRRLEELERRARKAEKERDHAWAELERLREAAARAAAEHEAEPGEPAAAEQSDEGAAAGPQNGADADEPGGLPLSADPNPRRRVIRQMLRKLVKKSKIGAAHTHEDNVYRGVADHEKGLAKEAMDLLYREGFFVPKPTAADPHVSIAPERLAEVQNLIAGRVENARLLRFCEE